jgi:hypothetical protein
MAQPILFPDVEQLVVDYLTEQYTARGVAATAHTAVPNPRPVLFTLVPRLGGTTRNIVVDQPTLGIECWGPTAGAAFELCALTRALVGGLAGQTLAGVMFYAVAELAGPTQLPDPDSNQARYVYTPSLTCRGASL